MSKYLFLLLSVALMLFALPKNRIAVSEISQLAKIEAGSACSKQKFALKRTCKKKCLKHQTHSEQSGKESFQTNCNVQVLGVLEGQSAQSILHPASNITTPIGYLSKRYSPPTLELEPSPPRFS